MAKEFISSEDCLEKWNFYLLKRNRKAYYPQEAEYRIVIRWSENILKNNLLKA